MLVDVFHNGNGGINFESGRDTYLSAFFDSPAIDLTRDDVKPEVGGFGVRPLDVWKFGDGRWQADFKLPPGLTPGWHDVRVRIRDSRPSNALRIAVDVLWNLGRFRSPEFAMASVGSRTEYAGVDPCRSGSLGCRKTRTARNVRVLLDDDCIEVVYVAPAGSGEPRQLNARLSEIIPAGSAELRVKVGEQTSAATEVQVTHE